MEAEPIAGQLSDRLGQGPKWRMRHAAHSGREMSHTQRADNTKGDQVVTARPQSPERRKIAQLVQLLRHRNDGVPLREDGALLFSRRR